MKIMNHLKSIFLTSALISGLSFTANAEINVVASVKPVHSLVSGVMDGVGKPDLIVQGSASPHTYSLRPSQARQLEDADLVFWMGHELESFLEQPLEAIATKAHVVELIDSSKLKKIQMREGGMFDAHAHDDHDDHDEHEGHDDHDEHEGHDDHGELTVSDETLATFNNYSQLFEFPKGAGCNLTSFKSGLHSVSTEGDHKDVELSYEFACSNPSQLKSLTINAFDRFSELETLNFEAVINNKALTKSLKSDVNKVIF